MRILACVLLLALNLWGQAERLQNIPTGPINEFTETISVRPGT